MTSRIVASSEEPETEGLTGEAPAKAPSVAPPVPPQTQPALALVASPGASVPGAGSVTSAPAPSQTTNASSIELFY